MRRNSGGRPPGGQDKQPRKRRLATNSELQAKSTQREQTKTRAAARGHGNMQRALAGNGAAASAGSVAGQSAAQAASGTESDVADNVNGVSANGDNHMGGAHVTSASVADDDIPDGPPPRARRDERPADVEAELDEEEQLNESGNLNSNCDTSSVMGKYLKAVYARLQSETTSTASRNALEAK